METLCLWIPRSKLPQLSICVHVCVLILLAVCCSNGVCTVRIKIQCYGHLTFIVEKVEEFMNEQPRNWKLLNEVPNLEQFVEKHLEWAQTMDIRVGNIGCGGLLIFGPATYAHRRFIASFPGCDKVPNHPLSVWNPKEREMVKEKKYVWFVPCTPDHAAHIIDAYQALADEQVVKIVLRVPGKSAVRAKLNLFSPLVRFARCNCDQQCCECGAPHRTKHD